MSKSRKWAVAMALACVTPVATMNQTQAAKSAAPKHGAVSTSTPTLVFPQNCGGNARVEICVVSASLFKTQANNNEAASINLVLSVTNKTDTDIAMAIQENSMGFTPLNGPMFSDRESYSPRMSGIKRCSDSCTSSSDYTVFSPGVATNVSIQLKCDMASGAITVLRGTKDASFSAVFSIVADNMKKMTALSVSKFSFANGF